jgi:hypothetical protein
LLAPERRRVPQALSPQRRRVLRYILLHKTPAEYLIHWVRPDALYHLPCTFTLPQKADRVHHRLAQGPPFTPEPMKKLLRHIYKLPRNKAVKRPELE